MKICSICNISKELTSFYTCRTTKDKHWGQCKECVGARSKEQWSAKTDEQKRKYIKIGTNRRRDNYKKYIIIAAKLHAKRKNVPFSLTEKDIHVPEFCPYLGIPIFPGKGKLCDNSPSIDEIVPGKGYVPGNIQIVSHKANSMKRNATPFELVLFAKKIIEQFGE